MLAQAATLIPYNTFAVAGALTDPQRRWLVRLDGDGGTLLARVGVSIGRLRIYKHVELEIGNSRVLATRTSVVLPVSWKAVGGPPIFPRMEGTLHVEPDGPQSTRLTLNARYDPPMGAIGKLIDRALMHRLAQATMDDFIDRVGAVLTDQLRGRPEPESV